MRTWLIVICTLVSLMAGGANAQTCGPLVNLVNGQPADATQVMANFNTLLACITTPTLRGYIAGLTMSTDQNSAIMTTTGSAASDDTLNLMAVTVPTTKALTAAWAVGLGNGCLDTGSVAANTWYHLFVIMRTDTGVVDALCSASAASPRLPSGYSKKRRIGSFKTDANSHILNFSQNGDEFLWITPQNDQPGVSLGTTVAQFSLSAPPGVITTAIMNTAASSPSTGAVLVLIYPVGSSVQQANVPPGNATLYVPLPSNSVFQSRLYMRTDTNRSVQAVSSAAGTLLYIVTVGWVDTRGRFN